MSRLLAAAVTCVLAAALAVGAGFGALALINTTPDQPNVPLVTFPPAASDGRGAGGDR